MMKWKINLTHSNQTLMIPSNYFMKTFKLESQK